MTLATPRPTHGVKVLYYTGILTEVIAFAGIMHGWFPGELAPLFLFGLFFIGVISSIIAGILLVIRDPMNWFHLLSSIALFVFCIWPKF